MRHGITIRNNGRRVNKKYFVTSSSILCRVASDALTVPWDDEGWVSSSVTETAAEVGGRRSLSGTYSISAGFIGGGGCWLSINILKGRATGVGGRVGMGMALAARGSWRQVATKTAMRKTVQRTNKTRIIATRVTPCLKWKAHSTESTWAIKDHFTAIANNKLRRDNQIRQCFRVISVRCQVERVTATYRSIKAKKILKRNAT